MELNPIEVEKSLKGAEYPASREDLVALAEDNDASDEVIEGLRSMPEDHFDGPDEVIEALDE